MKKIIIFGLIGMIIVSAVIAGVFRNAVQKDRDITITNTDLTFVKSVTEFNESTMRSTVTRDGYVYCYSNWHHGGNNEGIKQTWINTTALSVNEQTDEATDICQEYFDSWIAIERQRAGYTEPEVDVEITFTRKNSIAIG